MDLLTTHRVAFSGCPAGTFPLAWGQLGSLRSWETLDPDEYAMRNVRGQGSLAGVADMARVLDAVHRVIGRHDALRTRFRRDPNGDWVQVVADAGELEITEFTAGAGAVEERVQQVVDLLATAPFHADDLPVRIAVVTVDGAPQAMVVILWHLIADGIAAAIICQEVRRYGLDPEAEVAVPWQPRDIAAFERGPDGQRLARRAERYIRKQLPMSDVDALPVRGSADGPVTYCCAFIDSPATAASAQILARQHGISPVTAVLSGYALTLAAWLGRTSYTITLGCANREHPRLRDSIANLAQFVPVHLDVGAGGLADVCHAVADATLPAYRYGHHDPERYETALREAERERGAPVHLPYSVNLRAIGQTRFDAELSDEVRARLDGYSRLDAGGLRALTSHSRAWEFHGPLPGSGGFLSFTLWILTDMARMMVHTDSRTMADGDPGRLLAGVESTMLDAACSAAARA